MAHFPPPGHLSRLLDATAGRAAGGNRTALQWATDEFAAPLGLPWLYSFLSRDPEDQGDTPRRPVWQRSGSASGSARLSWPPASAPPSLRAAGIRDAHAAVLGLAPLKPDALSQHSRARSLRANADASALCPSFV